MKTLQRLFALGLGVGLLTVPLAFVNAGTISVGTVSPSATVQPGTQISFTMQATDFGSTLTYTVVDSFSGTTISNANFNSNGVFAWTPTNNDSGVHNLTITGRDQVGNTALAYQQLTVQGTPTVSVQSLIPGVSVRVGQNMTFTANAFNLPGATFTLSDSFNGSTITSASFTSGGSFNWTPQTQDIGTHTLTIVGRDTNNNTASVTQTFTVTAASYLTVQSQSATNVLPGQPVTFTVVPTGFVSPTYTITDSRSGSSVTNANISSSGNFSWTPTTSDVGVHTLTIYASDYAGRLANTQVTVTVGSNTPSTNLSLTAPQPGTTVAAGTTVTFQAVASGLTSPLTFTLLDNRTPSSLTNINISANGFFTWTPTVYEVGAHTITVTARDQAGRTATAATTINVTGAVVTPPTSGTYKFYNYLVIGSRGDDVIALQERLTLEGVYTGPITGYYGVLTTAGVKAYQAKFGIEQVGVVGPITRARLNQ